MAEAAAEAFYKSPARSDSPYAPKEMIRDFDAGDADGIRKLLSGIPEAAQWPENDSLFGSQATVRIRVLEEDGELCGLMVFRTTTDEAEILNLAVDCGWRRRGVASRLMKDAVAASKEAGAQRIFLEVRESNIAARNFYAQMEFTEVGRRRKYYQRPLEDALVLMRKIE